MVSYFDYPYPIGLNTRITGLKNVLNENGISVNILVPNSRAAFDGPKDEQGSKFRIERVDLRFLKVRERCNFCAKLLLWLCFSVCASLRVARKYLQNRCLIQYQSTFSAIPALFAKIFFKATIVGDDIVLLNNFIDSIIVKLTDAIITPSIKTYSFAKQLGKNALYIPNGITKSVKNTVPSPDSRMIFVGSLSFDQNIAAIKNIFSTVEDLDKKGIMFEVIIVGGPLSYVENLMRLQVVKKGKIKFFGKVTPSKLTELLGNSFVGILPFFKDTPLVGGQRTKALEFFSHGLLVISGPEGIKGIEGIESGKHYLQVNSRDEMRDTISKVIMNPRDYREIAQLGYDFVLNNYSWEKVTAGYVKLVKGLI